MKTFKIALLAVCLYPLAYSGELNCVGGYDNGDTRFTLKFQGTLYVHWIAEPMATFTSLDDGKVEVGRFIRIESDENNKTSEYKGYDSYSLEKLTDTKEFGHFAPYDSCYIKLLVPENARNINRFETPATFSCVDSDGSITLSCEND